MTFSFAAFFLPIYYSIVLTKIVSEIKKFLPKLYSSMHDRPTIHENPEFGQSTSEIEIGFVFMSFSLLFIHFYALFCTILFLLLLLLCRIKAKLCITVSVSDFQVPYAALYKL